MLIYARGDSAIVKRLTGAKNKKGVKNMREYKKGLFKLLVVLVLGLFWGALTHSTPVRATNLGEQSKDSSEQPEIAIPRLNSDTEGFLVGDEKYFMRAIKVHPVKDQDEEDFVSPGEVIEVTDAVGGTDYRIDVYIVNDTPGTVAKDVKVRIVRSKVENSEEQTLSAVITSSNTEEYCYISSLTFKSADHHNISLSTVLAASKFSIGDGEDHAQDISGSDLEVLGSIDSQGRGFTLEKVSEPGKNNDGLTDKDTKGSGIFVGENSNGEVKYGYENIQVVRFNIHVSTERYYSCKTEVRPTVLLDRAKVTLAYTNEDREEHKDVKMMYCNFGDELFEVISDTITLTDDAHPDGVKLKNEEDSQSGVFFLSTLGCYDPGEQAVVTFTIRPKKGLKSKNDYGKFLGIFRVGETEARANFCFRVNSGTITEVEDVGGPLATQYRTYLDKCDAILLSILVVSTTGFVLTLRKIIKVKKREEAEDSEE